MTIDRTQFTVLIGPFVPNPHTVVLQVFHVCVAIQEPQQFVYDRLQMQFFCCKQRETVLQVEAHLVSEDAYRTSASAVALLCALRHDAVEQV